MLDVFFRSSHSWPVARKLTSLLDTPARPTSQTMLEHMHKTSDQTVESASDTANACGFECL
jgi:hypothetical protein